MRRYIIHLAAPSAACIVLAWACGFGAAAQRFELGEVEAPLFNHDNARNADAKVNTLMTLAFHTDPQSAKEYKIAIDGQKRVNDGAVRKILTPDQMEKWNQLTAKRSLPAKSPNATRSALSGAQVAGVHILDLSPIFRALAAHANALGLSADQKTLLKDLEDVTRQGLVWISLGKSDKSLQLRSRFMKHAEQVALLGILTEQQAEQVQAAVKEG